MARIHPYDGRRPLVLGRGLGVPRHQEAARVVFEVFDHTAHGNPVHVDVGNRHENRNLQHLAVEVLLLADHLGHHHTAVARREDQVRIVDAHAARLTEEGHNEKPEQQQQDGAQPHDADVGMVDEQMVNQPPQQQAEDARKADDSVSFLVDSHLRIVLEGKTLVT